MSIKPECKGATMQLSYWYVFLYSYVK